MSIQTPIQNIRFHFRPTHLSNWQSCNSIERYHKPVGYELIYMQRTWRQNVLLPPLNVTLFFFKAFVCTNFAITNYVLYNKGDSIITSYRKVCKMLKVLFVWHVIITNIKQWFGQQHFRGVNVTPPPKKKSHLLKKKNSDRSQIYVE